MIQDFDRIYNFESLDHSYCSERFSFQKFEDYVVYFTFKFILNLNIEFHCDSVVLHK